MFSWFFCLIFYSKQTNYWSDTTCFQFKTFSFWLHEIYLKQQKWLTFFTTLQCVLLCSISFTILSVILIDSSFVRVRFLFGKEFPRVYRDLQKLKTNLHILTSALKMQIVRSFNYFFFHIRFFFNFLYQGYRGFNISIWTLYNQTEYY